MLRHRVFRHPATAIAASILLASSTLVACDVETSAQRLFGPRPNAALMSLAQQAAADAAEHPNSDIGTLRATQATQLFDEVERICGYDKSGAVAASCVVERSPGDRTASPDPLAVYLTAPQVPAESADLVASHAIDLAVIDNAGFTPTKITSPLDQEIAKRILTNEYAVVYALQAAHAFVAPERLDAVSDLIDAHDARILALRASIIDPPEPAAGYEATTVDPATGEAAITQVEKAAEDSWRVAAAEAHSEPGRAVFIRGAADAINTARAAGFSS